jgi:hypothetical protein
MTTNTRPKPELQTHDHLPIAVIWRVGTRWYGRYPVPGKPAVFVAGSTEADVIEQLPRGYTVNRGSAPTPARLAEMRRGWRRHGLGETG